MSTTNYFNPDNYKPQVGSYQPQGFLAGMDYADDRMRWVEMANLQKALTQLEKNKVQEEFDLGFDKRQAQRGSETSGFNLSNLINQTALNTPNYGPTMVQGKMGEANSSFAKGEVDRQTINSSVQLKNSSNIADAAKNILTHIDRMAPIFGQGGMEGNLAYQQFRNQLPEEVRGIMPPMWGPQAAERLKLIRNQLVNTVEQQQRKEFDTHATDNNIREIEARKKGELEVANVRAAAKNRSMEQMLTEAKTDEQALRIAEAIMQEPDATPRLKERARVIADQARRNIAARADRESFAPGDINNPGAAGDRVRDRLDRGRQEQFVPGQVYNGRTGRYRYIGPRNPTDADLKNTKNWQKVS